MKISYGITVCNEQAELDNLLHHLSKHIRKDDEVVVTQDVSNEHTGVSTVIEKYEYSDYFKNFKTNTFNFSGDFSELKNYTKSQCSGDYIFHLDADEIPNPILIEQLPEILSINDTDLLWVPRINIVDGITPKHMEMWGWGATEQGWINFPDYQARVFRNTEDIKWKRPVHEHIWGCKTYSHLPPHEELTLKHVKDIKKQEKQNNLYGDIVRRRNG